MSAMEEDLEFIESSYNCRSHSSVGYQMSAQLMEAFFERDETYRRRDVADSVESRVFVSEISTQVN